MSGWNQLNEKRADIITDSANERYMSSAYLAQWTRQGTDRYTTGSGCTAIISGCTADIKMELLNQPTSRSSPIATAFNGNAKIQ